MGLPLAQTEWTNVDGSPFHPLRDRLAFKLHGRPVPLHNSLKFGPRHLLDPLGDAGFGGAASNVETCQRA